MPEGKRTQQNIFHLKYPARRDFFTWTELGCLCRALGYPFDMIRQNVCEETSAGKEGITVMQLQQMIDFKLLHHALHRSFNMHTADWNIRVLHKAVHLLHLNVISFQDLHDIRVAYMTYEAGDMKGLKLQQHTLLRTLKMCHRIISPMKLMHRVKHMKGKVEEPGRVQMYEFFHLIMWCDYLDSLFQAETMNKPEGKENELFKLVDFETLLTHQDKRRWTALDEQYLVEEWNFGHEQLGSKHMFKGEVVYTGTRLQQLQDSQLSDKQCEFSRQKTKQHKKNYKNLKLEINQSQRRVYRAHAGSIRPRPISAPSLSMYTTSRDTTRTRNSKASTVYSSVQRKLRSAPQNATLRPDTSDRPQIPELVRVQTPRVVTPEDLNEVERKMKNLEFDMITLGSRFQVKLEDELDFFIPGYRQRVPTESSKPAVAVDETPVEMQREAHWTPEIVQRLAYPAFHLSSHHAYTCDARFRGWSKTKNQRRLTSPMFDNSPRGRVSASKVRSRSPDAIQHTARSARTNSGMQALNDGKAGSVVQLGNIQELKDTEDESKQAVRASTVSSSNTALDGEVQCKDFLDPTKQLNAESRNRTDSLIVNSTVNRESTLPLSDSITNDSANLLDNNSPTLHPLKVPLNKLPEYKSPKAEVYSQSNNSARGDHCMINPRVGPEGKCFFKDDRKGVAKLLDDQDNRFQESQAYLSQLYSANFQKYLGGDHSNRITERPHHDINVTLCQDNSDNYKTEQLKMTTSEIDLKDASFTQISTDKSRKLKVPTSASLYEHGMKLVSCEQNANTDMEDSVCNTPSTGNTPKNDTGADKMESSKHPPVSLDKQQHLSSEQNLKLFNPDEERPRQFAFNEVTTQRLVSRVKESISPELKARIMKGDTGLKA